MNAGVPHGLPLVEREGYRFRQYLDTLAAAGDVFSPQRVGYGSLRVFDDVFIDAGARASFRAEDGLETFAYVLEGQFRVSHAGDPPVDLARGSAAHIVGGRGSTYEAHNATTAPARMLVVSFVASRAHEQARLSVHAFDADALGLTWVATSAGPMHEDESMPVGATARFGVAFLESGQSIALEPSWGIECGLFLAVLRGTIELNSGFLEQGMSIRLPLGSRTVAVQGVSDASVALVEVHMAFVQEIF